MDDILTRGVETVLPSKQVLADRLEKGPIKLYFGIDPTAPSLHLGHLTSLLKVRDFQQAGHEVVVMFGDFTARIGDPTDKDAVRKVLSQQEVEANMADYENQVLKILDSTKTTFHKNSEWYRQMPLEDFINLTTKVTVGYNLKRDMFQRRQQAGKEIYVNEFLYPILHGYDCIPLAAELEIGGNDQLFNMLTGRDLAKKIKNRDKFVLTLKLLVDPVGEKMGKTTNNMARLDDEPKEMFGKVMSWPDTLMPLGFEILTRLPTDIYQEALKGHPKEAKLLLAKEVIKIITDEQTAEQALKDFENTFAGGEGEVSAKEIEVEVGVNLDQVLIDQQLIKSKAEFRRLVEQGGVDYADQLVTDPKQLIDRSGLIRVGKHRFVKIKVK
jgi:tyrosyl-tRNA synthetase